MIALLISSILFSLGGVLMPPSEGFSRLLPSMGVLACFALGSALLSVAVSRDGLGSAYVMGLGMEAAITLTAGLLLLGERISAQQALGVVLVLGGLVLIRS